MTKVVKIIEDDLITGVKYGLVDVDDAQQSTPQATPPQNTKSANTRHTPAHTTPVIKQPGRPWQTKMSAAKKRIADAVKGRQK